MTSINTLRQTDKVIVEEEKGERENPGRIQY
jgi:hypothetical protein